MAGTKGDAVVYRVFDSPSPGLATVVWVGGRSEVDPVLIGIWFREARRAIYDGDPGPHRERVA
eukprot:6465614-Lingulodinium_polyedra.AAC.1